MRIALVGAGGMGGVHLNIYQSLNDVELVAVADVEPDKAREKVKDDNVKIYDNLETMLAEEEIDLLDVCTPTYLHPEHAIKAMNKGINVICEKPISISVGQAEKMVKTARDNNVFFMVAQVIRFWPEYRYLKKVYDKNIFGELKQLYLSRIGSRPNWSYQDWMLDVEKSGRVPIDLHVHDVDFIYYLLGKPAAVTSFGKEEGNNISYMVTHYQYDEDMLVEAEGAWYEADLPFRMTYRAIFEKAILEYKDDKLMIYEVGKEPREAELEDTTLFKSNVNIESVNGYCHEIRYFIDCIKQGKEPEISTPESTVEVLKIINRELESVERGEKIKTT